MGMTFVHTPMRNVCVGICANKNKGASNSDGRALSLRNVIAAFSDLDDPGDQKMGLPDIIGLVGAFFYLLGYALIQLRIFTVDDPVIPLLNVLGGVALIYSLAWNFNLGSFISQVAWLIITVIGYIRFRLVSRRRSALPQE